MDLHSLRKHRARFEGLEETLLRALNKDPSALPKKAVHSLRYAINFAKLTTVRASDALEDVDVYQRIGPHAWKTAHLIEERMAKEVDFSGLAQVLPELCMDTRVYRAKLIEQTALSKADLDAEIGRRQIVLALGGGGGCGYGYGGLFTLLDRHHLNPSLICGTSIGALIGLYRARRVRHDAAAMLEASKTLAWNKVFSIGNEPSRYGLPARFGCICGVPLGIFSPTKTATP